MTMAIFPSFSFAHPGRTASDGCHYCRTNCDKWGVPWNERHCHGGGTVQGVQESVPVYNPPTNRPVDPTAIPYMPPPTKVPLIFPTITMVPTNTPFPTSIITETPVPKLTKIVVNKVNKTKKVNKQTIKKTFWQWLFRK